MIPIIIDILIILFVVFAVIKGYKNGLFATLINLAGVFIIIPLAIIISIPLTNVVYNDFSISESIQGEVRKFVDSKTGETEEINSDIVTEDDSKIKANVLKNVFKKAGEDYISEGKQTAKDSIVEDVTKLIIRAGLILILFILFSIILIIVKSVIGGILDSLPIIENLNGIGGAGVGLILALLKIFVLLYLISLVASFTPSFDVSSTIDNTLITNILNKNNPINLIIK